MKLLFKSTLFPLRFTLLLWIIKIIEWAFHISFATFGILPRNISGLKGIFFAPLIHLDFLHLISNTIPILLLGTTLFTFYPKWASTVFITCHLLGGFLVWLFGREFYHIGASGVLYGIAGFLISIGLFKKDFTSLLISIIIVLFYGGLIWGILPLQPGVSFESHLFGALVGVACAAYFGSKRNIIKVRNPS